MKDVLRGLLMLIGLFWFFTTDNLHWSWFFIVIVISNVIPEILIKKSKKENSRRKTQVKQSEKKVKKSTKTKKSDAEIIATTLEELDGYEFERLVAMYYAEKGYNPQIIGGAGDHEVDIIMIDPKENSKIAVQCKHWKTKNVGNDIILRLDSGKRAHKCFYAWCITTSNYTKAAKDAAERLNVTTYNKLHVENSIVKWQKQKNK